MCAELQCISPLLWKSMRENFLSNKEAITQQRCLSTDECEEYHAQNI